MIRGQIEMPKKYYLAARPETLVSIIHKGVLPENIKSEAKNGSATKLDLYETAETAYSHSLATQKQTYLLEYHLADDDDDTVNYDQVFTPMTHTAKLTCENINPQLLKCIHVLNLTHKDQVLRLLNDQCPYEIHIKPEFFATKKLVLPTPLVRTLTPQMERVQYIKTGDLLGSTMQTLVNTVNCVGVMGKGIAYSFKQQYPEMFLDYQQRCNKKEVHLGKPYVYITKTNRKIINFPTKGHWKNPSTLKDIIDGLRYLAEHAKEWGIVSIAVPPLGCGNGGLSWLAVKPLILEYLNPLKIPMEIYEPFVAANAKATPKAKKNERPASPGQPRLSSFFTPTQDTKKIKPNHRISPPEVTKQHLEERDGVDYIFDKGKNCIEAIQKGIQTKIIGTIDIIKKGDYYWLHQIKVEKDFRRKGIGTTLIAKALEITPQLQIPLVASDVKYAQVYNHLNDDYVKLIEHCISRGIIAKKINCCVEISRQPSPGLSL
jgi:O-acetyl-ADP-ribose deacetylase (regulator of RNase III)/GNAT superfamily N-acetyltransferase